MTKKDYKLIAGTLYDVKYSDNVNNKDRKAIATLLAIRFELNNPKFNRSKFLKACGLEA